MIACCHDCASLLSGPPPPHIPADPSARLSFLTVFCVSHRYGKFPREVRTPLNIMTDIARAHPFTSAVSCKSNTDEAKNASLISSMRAERKELHFTLNYKITVTDDERKSTKPIVKKNQFAQSGSQLLYGPHASHMRKLIPSQINKLVANGL